jgi:hypothetical protein
MRIIIVAVVATSAAVSLGCAGRAHRIDFQPLAEANRVEVRTSDQEFVKTVTDPAQIRIATDFIRRFETGWRDPLTGVRIPSLMLTFFRDNRFVGAYGIGDDYVVSNPPTAGFWSRKVPAEDIERLRRGLGIGGVRQRQ